MMKAEDHEKHMKEGITAIIIGIGIMFLTGGVLLIPGAIIFSFGLMRADLFGNRHND